MPTCKRCERVAATSEMRRSPAGGFLCKDNRERCERIGRAGEWPDGIDELAREVLSGADSIVTQCKREDVMRALARAKTMHHYSTELVMELCIRASREGNTQKAIADALGVPASTLHGLKRSAA